MPGQCGERKRKRKRDVCSVWRRREDRQDQERGKRGRRAEVTLSTEGRVRLRGDAIINRRDQLNRNGIRAIACAGSIISRTGVQGARVSFNTRIGVSIIAISFIRLFPLFFFVGPSRSRNSSDDIEYCGRELRRCAIKPHLIEACTRDGVISVTLATANFRGKYVRQPHTRLNCLFEV